MDNPNVIDVLAQEAEKAEAAKDKEASEEVTE